MRENKFQSSLIRELKKEFPGCFVTKLDSSLKQGIPDLIVLYGDTWATLECKKSKHAPHRPNQDYYQKLFNEMSYSAFVYPENKEEIINELRQVFGARRQARALVAE